MPPKRKVVLQATESGKGEETKKSELDVLEARKKRFKRPEEDDEVVDYGEGQSDSPSQPATMPEQLPTQGQVQLSPEEEERARITKALESWCNNNIAKEKDDPDLAERVSALAEVGLLLVFDLEKYNSADTMRTELEDIGSIIGGEQVVTRYINFILSLQNQLKKTRALAERQLRQHQQMIQQVPFAPPHFHQMPMQMMGHPGVPPMFMQGAPHPMYMAQHGFPPQGHVPARGNMTLNATGEMTAVEKHREKERKRKEILAECTEHLKALLERVTKSTDPSEKAKIYELIDKVKKRIESLKEVAPAPVPAKAPAPKGPIRGYFGNQYINPKLLEQQQQQTQQDQAEQ
jgi:hypothetical protein